MFSVGFPWQIQSPARRSGASWGARSGATSATSVLCPRTSPGRAGRAASLPGPFSSPQWALPLPKRPIPALEWQEGKAGTARGGQRCPTWWGPPSAATLRIAMETAAAAHQRSRRLSPGPRPGTGQRSPSSAGAVGSGAQPPGSTFPCLVRRWAGAHLGGDCLEEPLSFLFHPDTRVTDRRGVALSWRQQTGTDTGQQPCLVPALLGRPRERMEMRAGEYEPGVCPCPPLPSLKLRPSQPATPVSLQSPCPRTRPRGCARRSGTCSPGPFPWKGDAPSFSGIRAKLGQSARSSS